MQAHHTDTFEEVKQLFSDYLEQHRQRKTQERFIILEEIYSRSDHFDAETLFNDLKRKGHNISRATVYNTLELLVACDLIKKHQFGNLQTQYEKAYHYKQHDHLICNNCQAVLEFCDPRLEQIQTKIGELLGFKITGHSLILHGHCERENCPNASGQQGGSN
ncbi:MAG: transcriptional repressor [Chitinophagales bacterium]|nr:MAG: transcriptional repressor [Chitinophagales bacterium]